MKPQSVRIRFSKYGHNLYTILYGPASPERIESETARLRDRAEQLYGEPDKEYFRGAIEDDFEK